MANITTNFITTAKLPAAGRKAPDFIVTKTDLSEIHLKNYFGRRIVLSVFPSLDTPTCASVIRKLNELGQQFPDTLILCISADLPFAQKRFCSEQQLNNIQPASTFRHPDFGKNYGVTIENGPFAGLLARAIIVIDEKSNIIYTEHVKKLTDEPNYSAIKNVLQKQKS